MRIAQYWVLGGEQMSTKITKTVIIFMGLGLLLKLAIPSQKHRIPVENPLDSDRVGALAFNNSDKTSGIRPILLGMDAQNTARVNGLWALVRNYTAQKSTGQKNELALPLQKENKFYIQLRKPSIVWMTQITEDEESKQEYHVSFLSAKNISIFQQISDDTVQVYDLKLIEFDASSRRIAPKSIEGQDKDEERIILELREMYDRKSQQILSVNNPDYEIEGSVELENKKIASFYVSINDFELNPSKLNSVGKGDYDYGVENEEGALIMGKAQAAFINKNEFNLYFISGLYKGYTLIFSRKLSNEQLYEQENAQVELEANRLSRENSEFHAKDKGEEFVGEEAINAQNTAVAQRQHLGVQDGTQRNPANISSQNDNKRQVNAKKINDLLKSWDQGKELSAEEEKILEEHSNEIDELGGFNFSQE